MTVTDSVLLIGHGHPRYQTALADWAGSLRETGCDVTRTTPRTWYGEEVLSALAEPRDLVVYFGHGYPGVWVGYVRLNATTIADVDVAQAHRLVAGLCCDSLTAPADGQALSTALLEGDVASRFLGYDGSLRFADNEAALATVVGAYRDARANDDDGVEAVVDALGGGWTASEDAPTLRCVD